MIPFYRTKWFTSLVGTLLVLLVIYMLIQLKPLLMWFYDVFWAVLRPLVIAMIISYVLNPIVCLLNERKVPRTAAVLLIYATFIATMVVILMNLIPMFMKQLTELNEHLPDFTMKAQSIINQVNENRLLPESIRTGFYNALENIEKQISAAVTKYIDGIGSTLNMVLVAFIIPFLAFYMLKDFRMIERGVVSSIPKAHRKPMIKLLVDIDQALGNYIRGQLIVCVIVGVMAYIGYMIIGIQYPLLLACGVAIFNIIPYLGPYFGAAPALLMAAMVSWQMVLYVIIVNMSVQILEGNLISPQIVGRSLQMHPLSIIIALLIGGELAGIIGLILAVPTYAVLKVVVHHVMVHYKQRKPV